MRVVSRFFDLLREGESLGVELWLSIITVVWGIYVVLPWTPFLLSFGGSPDDTKTVLGSIWIAVGLVKCRLVVMGLPKPRRMAALLGTVLWLTLGLAYFNVNGFVAPVVYSLFALMNAWVFLRLSQVLR